mmetsp:Transcript_4592/g.10503  ORF Transcript_4592/g.10503 Transcript_4592/m.10503 type:complete len:268 (+) Transcript_4592:884-1687(+)
MNLPVLFLGEDCREIIIHVFSETCVDAAAATRIVATEIAIETAGVPVHRHHRVVVVVATATSTGGSDKKDLSKGANDFQPTAAVDGVVAVANHHVQRRQRRPIHSSSISSSSILANTHIHGNNTADNIRDHKVEPPEFAVANGRVSVFPAGTSTTSTTTVGSGTTSTTGTTKNHQEAEHDLQTIRGPIQVVDQCDGRIAIAAAAAAVANKGSALVVSNQISRKKSAPRMSRALRDIADFNAPPVSNKNIKLVSARSGRSRRALCRRR